MIIPFYANEAPDDRGRYLSELQNWPDDGLEAVHDYIQWMFPLRERSGANPGAPTLDAATISAFHARPDLQDNLRTSFRRMLRFYGFEAQPAPLRIVKGPDFAEASANWLTPWNHNFLRITRILKSLALLGLEEEAKALFVCLEKIYKAQGSRGSISAETFRYWESTLPQARGAGK